MTFTASPFTPTQWDKGTLEVYRQKLAAESEAAERVQYERLRVKFQ